MRWYDKTGADGDVVISTRVRLARNLRAFPFPSVMTDEQRKQVCDRIASAFERASALGSFHRVRLETFDQTELASMVERHIISPEFAKNPKGREIMLSEDESVSAMMCEEDHLRLQILSQGLEINRAFDLADKLDNILNEQLDFAFDERLGFLTACPTNLGTGMRISAMMHLPAAEATGTLKRIGTTISNYGLTIRGMYGEGSGSKAALYQISNSRTLGVSEKEIISKLTDLLGQLIELERAQRKQLVESPDVVDNIWRSLGILRTARRLSSAEFAEYFSAVRLGALSGVLEGMDPDRLASLFIESQPATLMMMKGKSMSPQERDAARAELVRNTLK